MTSRRTKKVRVLARNRRPKAPPRKRSRPRKRPIQLELRERRWGGRRPGAGRKATPGRRRVPHRRRPRVNRRHPIHVTTKVAAGLGSLRRPEAYKVIRRCLRKSLGRFGMRMIEFSVMRNHLHFVVEAMDRLKLSRGIKGLLIRIAKRLNKLWGRKGTVFPERYHARPWTTPLEVRHGLAYVVNNRRRHAAQSGQTLPKGWVDPCSSGPAFSGWAKPVSLDETVPVLVARTWLLSTGWRRHGLIVVNEVPGR